MLFDTGFGANGAPTVGKLAENMKAAGLDPTKVDTVVISHFHGDHISGLWAKETSEQIYPNAQILMPEVEYKFWTDPALVEKLPEGNRPIVRRMQSTFPTWKNVSQFNDGAEVAPEFAPSPRRDIPSDIPLSWLHPAASSCSSKAT